MKILFLLLIITCACYEEDFGDITVTSKLLGKGAFASVFEAVSTKTGKKYACKIQDRIPKNTDVIAKEKEVLDLVTENKVQNTTQLKFYNFEAPDKFYFGFDKYSGDSYKYWKTLNGSEQRYNYALFFARRMFESLAKLHSLRWGHFDLKPENIFTDSEGVPYIGDFGLALNIPYRNISKDFRGSPWYMPPEMHSKVGFNMKADVWAMGVVLFELVSGKTPYSGAYSVKNIAIKSLNLSGFTKRGWTYNKRGTGVVNFFEMIFDHMLCPIKKRKSFKFLLKKYFKFDETKYPYKPTGFQVYINKVKEIVSKVIGDY